MAFDIQQFISSNYNPKDFSHLHWTGTFQDYVDLVLKRPEIARNSFSAHLRHDYVLWNFTIH